MYRVVEKTNLIAHIFGKLSLPVISSSHAIIWEIGGGPWCGRTRVVSSLPREKLTSCAWGVFCHGEQMGAAATCRPAADVRWSCFSLFLPYLPNFLWVEHLLIFYKACWEQLVLKPVKNMCVCCLTHLTPKSSSDRKWLVKMHFHARKHVYVLIKFYICSIVMKWESQRIGHAIQCCWVVHTGILIH